MAPFVVLYIFFLCDPTIGSLGTHFSRINRKVIPSVLVGRDFHGHSVPNEPKSITP